jgi:hypothetical protein
MYKKSFLQQPDKEFLARANTVNSQCTQHSTEWNIEPNRLNSLNTLTANANTAYEANNDAATRNHTTSTNKKVAFAELKEFLGVLINYLEGNLLVSDAALEIMGLRPRKHKASEPLSRPGEPPALTVVRQHGEMTAYVSRIDHRHPTDGVKVKPYHGFKLRWRFEGETWWRVEITTRLHIRFDREEEGKRIEMSAAWINLRLEEGPWSDDITEIVG